MRARSGISVGEWTLSSSPFVNVTEYSTLGVVASSSRPYSRSSALAHDVHVQQAEEAAAKPEAERLAGLGHVRQGGVVERELLEGVAEL